MIIFMSAINKINCTYYVKDEKEKKAFFEFFFGFGY